MLTSKKALMSLGTALAVSLSVVSPATAADAQTVTAATPTTTPTTAEKKADTENTKKTKTSASSEPTTTPSSSKENNTKKAEGFPEITLDDSSSKMLEQNKLEEGSSKAADVAAVAGKGFLEILGNLGIGTLVTLAVVTALIIAGVNSVPGLPDQLRKMFGPAVEPLSKRIEQEKLSS